MAYTSIQTLQNKLNGVDLSESQIAYFNDVLSGAIDKYIENETGTMFGSTEIVSVYVSGDDSEYVTIPTMHEITSVARVDENGDEEAIPVDEYSTYPRGSVNKYALRMNSGSWDGGMENIKITGKLGYKEIPDDIVSVATELAMGGVESDNQVVKSEKVGDWSVTYADMNESISVESRGVLSAYKRISRSM